MSIQITKGPSQLEPYAYSIRYPEYQQVKNNAEGYVYQVRDLMRLQRYAIIGCEDGTYYAVKEKLERQNISCIDRLLAAKKAREAVDLLKEISVNRRNIKQNSLLKALAVLARSNDEEAKIGVYSALSDICRIPTHLFMFIKFCEEESNPGTGWGRAHKRAIGKWYTNFTKNPEKLARLVTKFKCRDQWRHRDVVRLAHPSCRNNNAVAFIIRYIVKDLDKAIEMYQPDTTNKHDESLRKVAELLGAFERALGTRNAEELCDIINTYKLTWEQCPTEMLRKKKVWFALLPHMHNEALVRSLGRMSSLGMFAADSEEEEIALKQIRSINTEQQTGLEMEEEGDLEVDGDLPRQQSGGPSSQNTNNKKHGYLHPFKILVGLYTYKSGRGQKGSLKWTPNIKIVEALEGAFYQAFDKVEPTNKKYFLAVDVSSSMSQPVLGSSCIDCATAAAAMMIITKRVEERSLETDENRVIVKGFSHELQDIEIEPEDNLTTILKKTNSLPMGGTDCSLPMKCAIEEKIKDIDVFIVYTDNETWSGNVHPFEALRQYREYSSNPNVKLIVCGMCVTEFTIADPEDDHMLDIVGFDPNAPQVISEFVMNKI